MQANASTIVVVTQMQPMSVLFTVPEDSLSEVLQRLRSGQKLAVDAFDRSLTNKIASGTLSNSDNEIDTTTGTLKLRALFDNSKFELFPSQFVNVRLLLDTLHDAIVVPGAAMQQGASGSYVYVVKADNTVSRHPCGGLFVFIGADAETTWLPTEIARDRRGYVLTGEEVVKAKQWSSSRDPYLLETSVPGVFACGDVRLSPVKRVASAVGEGSMAIAFVHRYLANEGRV